MNTADTLTPAPAKAIAKHTITMTSEFVPWSKSRNAKPNPKLSDYSLNWRVTLLVAGREILTTDYQAGIGHCPSLKAFVTVEVDQNVRRECETGHRWGLVSKVAPILPKIDDVLYCLLSEGDAIDHPTYEDWASDFGYDVDSRKGETIYRACLETGLKLRAGLGDAALSELRDAFHDY